MGLRAGGREWQRGIGKRCINTFARMEERWGERCESKAGLSSVQSSSQRQASKAARGQRLERADDGDDVHKPCFIVIMGDPNFLCEQSAFASEALSIYTNLSSSRVRLHGELSGWPRIWIGGGLGWKRG